MLADVDSLISCFLYHQVYSHISAILGIQPMTHASAEKLRAMVDTTDEHLRMLRRFDIETDEWSSIICVILLGKLDADTRNQWEIKTDLPSMPDVKALFSHMEQRILAIRNVEQSARHQHHSAGNGKVVGGRIQRSHLSEPERFRPYETDHRKSHAQSASGGRQANQQQRNSNERSKAPACLMCGPDVHHFLWNCEKFKQLAPQRQEVQLANWNVCKVCLIANHAPSECKKGNCPICLTERHNSAICPKAKPKQVNHLRRAYNGRANRSTD